LKKSGKPKLIPRAYALGMYKTYLKNLKSLGKKSHVEGHVLYVPVKFHIKPTICVPFVKKTYNASVIRLF
jgi:hypothetical protein